MKKTGYQGLPGVTSGCRKAGLVTRGTEPQRECVRDDWEQEQEQEQEREVGEKLGVPSPLKHFAPEIWH